MGTKRVRYKWRVVSGPVPRHGLRAHPQTQASAFRETASAIHNGNGRGTDPQSVLLKTIPAIPVIIKENGWTELGPITHLAASALFESVGEGFSACTIKVHCGAQCYFVFREDLERIGSIVSEHPLSRESNGGADRLPALLWPLAQVLVDPNEGIVPRQVTAEFSRRATS